MVNYWTGQKVTPLHYKAVFAWIITSGMLSACNAADLPTAVALNSNDSAAVRLNVSTSYSSDYLMGKFNPAKTKLFVKIPKKYANRSGMYLRQEALSAFIEMQTAAKQSGIRLTIHSATRNFNAQKRIWERKWLGKRSLSDGTNVARDIPNPINKALRILEYSAMPGASRHHWGTDIDLNSFNNKWFESGKGLKLFKWLEANAEKYGFCRPYTANRPSGYKEEKWHWSYAPLSAPMLRVAQHHLHDAKITGFVGSGTASQIGVVQQYILGVSDKCR